MGIDNQLAKLPPRPRKVAEAMQEKKARHISLLNLQEVTHAVTDYFVICTAGSDSQMDAIAQEVEEAFEREFEEAPWQKEGQQDHSWLILDYVDVVVHVFRKDIREKYKLEQLWGDADRLELADPDATPTNERQIRF